MSIAYLLEGLIVRRLYLKRLLAEEKLINKEKAERLSCPSAYLFVTVQLVTNHRSFP